MEDWLVQIIVAVVIGAIVGGIARILLPAPFEVSVRCWSGVFGCHELAFDAVVELPSGSMANGDGEWQEFVSLSAERYRIQIEVDPSVHPGWVNIWYRPAD